MGWRLIRNYTDCSNIKDLYVELYGKYSKDYLRLNKAVVVDCDGIISDNKSHYDKNGKVMKSYGCYDKEMIKMMQFYGWKFYFVSADKAGYEITAARVKDLNCELYNKDEEGRIELVKELRKTNDIVAFIGDSISDILAMNFADFAGTVNNAPKVVKKYCDYVSSLDGGSGGLANILENLHKGYRKIKKEIKFKK